MREHLAADGINEEFGFVHEIFRVSRKIVVSLKITKHELLWDVDRTNGNVEQFA